MARNRPLAGLRGWVITDDKAGMQVQARGVAEALGLQWELKQVAPKGLKEVAVGDAIPGAHATGLLDAAR